jgi:hypothetical protein
MHIGNKSSSNEVLASHGAAPLVEPLKLVPVDATVLVLVRLRSEARDAKCFKGDDGFSGDACLPNHLQRLILARGVVERGQYLLTATRRRSVLAWTALG